SHLHSFPTRRSSDLVCPQLQTPSSEGVRWGGRSIEPIATRGREFIKRVSSVLLARVLGSPTYERSRGPERRSDHTTTTQPKRGRSEEHTSELQSRSD